MSGGQCPHENDERPTDTKPGFCGCGEGGRLKRGPCEGLVVGFIQTEVDVGRLGGCCASSIGLACDVFPARLFECMGNVEPCQFPFLA